MQGYLIIMEYDECNGNDPCNSFRHLHSDRNGWQWMQLSHLTGSNSESAADTDDCPEWPDDLL